jgi:hypothetical protein
MCFKLVTKQAKQQKGEKHNNNAQVTCFYKHGILVLTYQFFDPSTLLGVVERDKETGHYLE